MTSRERLMVAMDRGKPDHLPTFMYSWTPYYLKHYLGGCDQFEAYRRFGLDWCINVEPIPEYDDGALAGWLVEQTVAGTDDSGRRTWQETVNTPRGTLTRSGFWDEYTDWESEPLIKTQIDFEIFRRHYPVPIKLDASPVLDAKERTGDNGILRATLWGYGQPGVWQSFCRLVGVQQAILWAVDEPDWTQYVLQCLADMQLRVIELMEGLPIDLVENGGAAASNTVISPNLHRGFCVRYDKQIHDALHRIGLKSVYHLCGGLMDQLENVFKNGADGIGSMAPVGVGGDCDLSRAYNRVARRMFILGGFDQVNGFELGTPERARAFVLACHAACPEGAYICSPTDNFFHGEPASIQAFADAARECTY